MIETLCSELEGLNTLKNVRSVILTSEGPAFSSGHDLRELVRGIAAAAGCQLVASCDIVVASETSKFVVPGQKLGFFCTTPGIALARAVPRKVALDMLLTAEPIDAQAALRCGLVSRVVPEKEVKREALKVAHQIGQYSRAVTALGKAIFYSQIEMGVTDAYRSLR
ncbi:enoyl-CoA hydratase/isomerase family protein [Oesophagostomum dentatum]|uniref:Enoyl-CoA hydratase domain-containing protein 3, mitochondrial n=1 Tax=Oesophagostomum dentatum TaxID=61180 RepID=A0A0B1SSA8_OESDE|nr:enoyl-CoA hydratase/isomerase family protein [Oesophagostomum dentatum]